MKTKSRIDHRNSRSWQFGFLVQRETPSHFFRECSELQYVIKANLSHRPVLHKPRIFESSVFFLLEVFKTLLFESGVSSFVNEKMRVSLFPVRN